MLTGFRPLRVYYLYMPSIVGKRQGNQTYYYLVESARVDGKPRIVSQQYLGSAAEVMAKLSDAPAGEPVRTQHKGFGDLAAVWSVMERLDVAGVIDAVVPRRSDAAASVGTYICLATANRIVAPCSKLAFADWWDTTAGPLDEVARRRAGSPSVLEGDGPPRRGRPGRDRDRAGPGDGQRVRVGPVRAGAGHDQLRQ